MSTLTRISDQTVDPRENDVSGVVIEGEPRHTAWVNFVGDGEGFRSGVWESTAGVFRGPMDDQIEFCHIVEGEARIVVDDGTEFTVGAGDSFVMDNGLQPVWHVEKYVKKHFVIASTKH